MRRSGIDWRPQIGLASQTLRGMVWEFGLIARITTDAEEAEAFRAASLASQELMERLEDLLPLFAGVDEKWT